MRQDEADTSKSAATWSPDYVELPGQRPALLNRELPWSRQRTHRHHFAPPWGYLTDRQLRTPTSAHTKGRRPIVQVPSVGMLRHCSPPHQTAPVHRITTLRGRLNQRWDQIVASSHWPTKVTPTPASREIKSKLATTHPPQRNASNYITHTLTLLAEPVQPVTHSTKISSRPVYDNLAKTELHMIELHIPWKIDIH